MKNKASRKAKRLFAVILATTLVFGLLMSMPLAVGAAHYNPNLVPEEISPHIDPGSFVVVPGGAQTFEKRTQMGPFMVTHPIGATYVLGEHPDPLLASFEYDSTAGKGLVDSATPITFRWYWSDTNSNTSRENPILGESTIPYSDKFKYSAEHFPATDLIGVKYYYAVVTYKEPPQQIHSTDITLLPNFLGGSAIALLDAAPQQNAAFRKEEPVPYNIVPPPPAPIPPLEVVTDPARVEVIASFEVKKTDEDGQPLAGAVLLLAPTDGKDAQDVAARTYEATTGADGIAKFTASIGVYILSEKKAPDGYEGTDTEYPITIAEDGVKQPSTAILTHGRTPLVSYKTITIVNKPIATPTPTPTLTPTPTPTPAPASTPGPSSVDLDVWKTDANGAYLSGAVFSLIPDGSYTQDSSVKSYEEATVNGLAHFVAAPGYYILSEKQAPAGYNAAGDKYYIQIKDGAAFIIDPETEASKPYAPVTFINKEIPKLDDKNHFAFMQGYPEGDFRPDSNMTRAEAVVMFSRLLSKKMDLEEDFRKPYYPDADLSDWYANQVCYMYELGVLTDYSRDTRFRPDEPVTRAEFATLATHFEDLELIDTNKFSDVPNSHWAIKYINSAEAKGWITGYPDGTFKPEDHITRAEVVTLVGRMIDRYADQAYIIANRSSLPRNYWDLSTDYWGYYMVMEASIGHDYIKDADGEHWDSTYK